MRGGRCATGSGSLAIRSTSPMTRASIRSGNSAASSASGSQLCSDMYWVPPGTRPDDTKSLADSDALHLRRESPDVIPHAGLDVAGRCRRALQHIELSIGGLDAIADASKIMLIRG